MKNSILISILLLGIGPLLIAQPLDHDIQKSLEQARDSNKYVLMVFSGSDWCKPCIQLKKKVLSDSKFSNYSADHLVIHEVDFPYRKKNRLTPAQQEHNNALAERYNKEGMFPKLVLLNQEEELISEVNYKQYMEVESFIFQIKSQIENQQ